MSYYFMGQVSRFYDNAILVYLSGILVIGILVIGILVIGMPGFAVNVDEAARVRRQRR